MPARSFARLELRTTDVATARAFFEELLLEGCPDVSLLPEAAVARGAQPHWLGHLGLADAAAVAQTAAAFIARGGMQLGPARAAADGSPIIALRDAGGAMLALGVANGAPMRGDVASHQLHTPKLAQAICDYGELLRWEIGAPVDLGALGVHQPFSFAAQAPRAGVMADITDKPQIHPQWLHYFRVPQLPAALALVRAAGGNVVGPFELPDGLRLAACDHPLGGAFGLMALPG